MNDPIQFYSQGISFQPTAKKQLRSWLKCCAQKEKCRIDSLHFVYCSDEFLHKLNLDFLNHDTLTDVITFHYEENKKNSLCGEVYISIPRIHENARDNGHKMIEELHRVMAHGLLHLIGYNDSSKAKKLRMTEKEDYFLSLRKF